MSTVAKFVLVGVIGYLLGSIPFGVLVSRWKGKVDVRQHGSGKMGATNVMRTIGHKAAVMVFSLDLAKGALAVIIAGLIVGRDSLMVGDYGVGVLVAQVTAALAAMAGHSRSVFLKFHGGGRGVATFFGGLVALYPPAAIFGGEIFIIGVGLTKFVSLGSIIAAVSTYAILAPLTVVHGFPIEYLIYALVGTVVIIIMHRDNIARLLAGKERKLGEKAKLKEHRTENTR